MPCQAAEKAFPLATGTVTVTRAPSGRSRLSPAACACALAWTAGQPQCLCSITGRPQRRGNMLVACPQRPWEGGCLPLAVQEPHRPDSAGSLNFLCPVP